ncbi:MAG: hypothetical protein PVG42_14395 [Lysobacterales bacterium]|jgi:hypothetical protein
MRESKTAGISETHLLVKQQILRCSLILVLLFSAQVAWGAEGQCGWGEVESTFQALPVGYFHVTDFGTEHRLAGLGGGYENCQFRVFADGQTYTFNAGDFVVGGVVYMFDYPNWGFTRAEAIDDTEAIEDHIWFGPTGGELVEQNVERTGYKQFVRPDWGLTLYQSRGFVAQLTPGEYTSYWEATYYGVPANSATVYITVLPNQSLSEQNQ